MRKALAPLLSDDDDPAGAICSSPVELACRSRAARAKAAGKRTPDSLPVHSFRTLLADLATLTHNHVQPAAEGAVVSDVLASPTPVQPEAFRLLKVRPRNVPSSAHPSIAPTPQYHNSLTHIPYAELRPNRP